MLRCVSLCCTIPTRPGLGELTSASCCPVLPGSGTCEHAPSTRMMTLGTTRSDLRRWHDFGPQWVLYRTHLQPGIGWSRGRYPGCCASTRTASTQAGTAQAPLAPALV